MLSGQSHPTQAKWRPVVNVPVVTKRLCGVGSGRAPAIAAVPAGIVTGGSAHVPRACPSLLSEAAPDQPWVVDLACFRWPLVFAGLACVPDARLRRWEGWHTSRGPYGPHAGRMGPGACLMRPAWGFTAIRIAACGSPALPTPPT